MPKQIAIIGGSPAGIEAALTVARYTPRVTLVSDRPAGSWHKLLPSRVWLTAVKEVRALPNPPLAFAGQPDPVAYFDLGRINRHVQEVTAEWDAQQAKQIQQAGVTPLTGRATFLSPNRLAVTTSDHKTSEIDADTVIIATGTELRLPPFLASDGRRVFTPGTLDQLATLPRSVLMIGDGPVGFEFVHLFVSLGIAVTWLVLPGGPGCVLVPERVNRKNATSRLYYL